MDFSRADCCVDLVQRQRHLDQLLAVGQASSSVDLMLSNLRLLLKRLLLLQKESNLGWFALRTPRILAAQLGRKLRHG